MLLYNCKLYYFYDMQLYLPIAEVSIDAFALIALGTVAGTLSGLFGIGGGFLITPMLIFMGIPPAVALSSSANQTIAASFSSFLSNWQNKNVDIRIGFIFSIGSIVGAICGVYIFAILQNIGLIDITISIVYVLLLGSIGIMLAIESIQAIYNKRNNIIIIKKDIEAFNFIHTLPFQAYFPHSKISCSLLIPIIIGFFIGILVALSGIGGGFILVPTMIYLLKIPTLLAVGTSSYQIALVTIFVTILQSVKTHTVDLLLSTFLMIGSIFGVHLGIKLSYKVPAEELRALLAIVVLSVVMKLAINLLIEPTNLYVVDILN